MHKYLFQEFLEDQVEDELEVITKHGTHGLLREFESWLERHGMDFEQIERNYLNEKEKG